MIHGCAGVHAKAARFDIASAGAVLHGEVRDAEDPAECTAALQRWAGAFGDPHLQLRKPAHAGVLPIWQ
jgi:hypothetical protein